MDTEYWNLERMAVRYDFRLTYGGASFILHAENKFVVFLTDYIYKLRDSRQIAD